MRWRWWFDVLCEFVQLELRVRKMLSLDRRQSRIMRAACKRNNAELRKLRELLARIREPSESELSECARELDKRARELDKRARELDERGRLWREMGERMLVTRRANRALANLREKLRENLATMIVNRHEITGKRITRPPGSILLAVAEFLYSKKTYEEVFVQTVEDLREEYFEALEQEEPRKARWIHARGVVAFFSAALLHLNVALVKRIASLWKAF